MRPRKRVGRPYVDYKRRSKETIDRLVCLSGWLSVCLSIHPLHSGSV